MEIVKDKDMNPGTPEDRITALERKMKDMDALVKGLTEELLDLKSIAMRLNKVSEERRQELKTVKPVLGGTPSGTVVMQKKGSVASTPRAPEPPKEEPMEMIMQTDGTLKPEKRKAGGEYVVASAGYSKKKGSVGDTKRKDNLIVAEDEEKSPSAKKE
jgi:hypothetical protein